jgi:hypothetical protein
MRWKQKYLNQAVKRNFERFPEMTFMFASLQDVGVGKFAVPNWHHKIDIYDKNQSLCFYRARNLYVVICTIKVM